MPKAIIVGAGIGGLAAAIALQRAGWRVQVVEQAQTPRELGFALALAPNALQALDELGLKQDVVAQAVAVKTFEVRRPDGRLMKRVDLRGDAVQSVVTLRPALHGTLLARLGHDGLLLGCRVSGLAGTSGVLVDGKPHLVADAVIAADGVGSIVRRSLHPDEPPPKPSGYHALRGVSHGVGDRLPADTVIYLGDGVEIGFARASESAVYWYISLVDELAAPDPLATLDRCTRGLDATALAIARAAAPGDIRADRLFSREPLDSWGRGPMTLLGDAAHPVLPHTAQGAALALEDAVALALALRAPAIEPALRLYERVRAARTRAVIRTGPRIAAMTTTRSRRRQRLRDALIRLTPAAALSLILQAHARDPHTALR